MRNTIFEYMSVEKSDIKIGAIHELGCRFDDSLELMEKDLYRFEGVIAAYRQVVQMADDFRGVIEKDLASQKLSHEAYEVVKGYFDKLSNILNQQSDKSESNKFIQQGKLQAMQMAVQIAKRFKEEEELKRIPSREGERTIGEHPGQSVKTKRVKENRKK